MSTQTHSEGGDFEFSEGDMVLVRVRNGGGLVAKFVAECTDIDDGMLFAGSTARFDLPFGQTVSYVRLRPYEAEFEVVGDPEEVRF